MGNYIHIKTTKFPIMEGEKEELVNDGLYGKALSIYLQKELSKKGYVVPSYYAEDWGWWVDIKTKIFNFGICIYSLSAPDIEPDEYVCCPSIKSEKQWSWSKFKFVNTKEIAKSIVDEIVKIFKTDKEITILEITEDFPLK